MSEDSIIQHIVEALRPAVLKPSGLEHLLDRQFDKRNFHRPRSPLAAFATGERISLETMASIAGATPVLLVGVAGSGKTTALLRLAELFASTATVPLLADPLPVADLPANEAIAKCVGIDPISLDVLTRARKCVLIVDQLNSFGSDHAIAFRELAEYCIKQGVGLVAAARPYGISAFERELPGKFDIIELLPLTSSEVRTCLMGVLDKHAVDRLDEDLIELCRTPLLLEMFAYSFASNGDVPSNRSLLYEHFLTMYLSSLKVGGAKSVPSALVEDVLRSLAADLDACRETHPITALERSVARLDIKLLGERYGVELTYHALLREVLGCPVLWPDERTSTFSFLHHSVQEFYAAQKMREQMRNGELSQSSLMAKANDRSLTEPFVFLCGLLDDSTSLVRARLDSGDLVNAARFVANSYIVDPDIVEELAVICLYTFKFTDGSIRATDVVAYDLIRSLQSIEESDHSLRSGRLKEDVDFFVDKYRYSLRARTATSPESRTDGRPIPFLKARSHPSVQSSYFQNYEKLDLVCHADAPESEEADEERDTRIFVVGERGTHAHVDQLLKYIDASNKKQSVVSACNALIRLSERGVLTNQMSRHVVEALEAHFADTRNLAREALVWAMHRIAGSEITSFLLRQVIPGGPRYATGMVIYVLGEQKCIEALPLLVELVGTERDPHVREDIARSLSEIVQSPKCDRPSVEIAAKTLLNMAEDSDAVVQLMARHGLQMLQRKRLVQAFREMPPPAKRYVSHWVAKNLSFSPGKEIMKPDVQRLVTLQAEIKAIEESLRELQGQYEGAKLDSTELFRLKTAYRKQQLELLAQLQLIVNSSEELRDLALVLETARNPSKDAQDGALIELESAAERNGWGSAMLRKIKEHKADVISLTVDVAVELSKKLNGH